MKFRPKSEDSRNFVKLKSGETIQGVFRGDLFEFRTHWNNRRSVVCSQTDSCELCKTGDKSKFRFRVNFVVKENDSYVAKVIEQGWNFYETLRSLNEGDYLLEKYVMKITRQGSGLKDTNYSIIPAPNGLVDSQLEEKLSLIELNDLGHITETEKEPADLYSDIPF